MKVLFILNSTCMGGATISFLNLIKGLNERNVKCYVIHPDKSVDPEFKKIVLPYVDKLYYAHLVMHWHDEQLDKNLKFRFKRNLKKLLKSIVENIQVKKIIKEVQPDIIHTNVGVIRIGYKLSQKNGIPHIWHIREYQTKDFHNVIEPSKAKFEEMLKDNYVITITRDILHYFDLENSSKAVCIYDGCYSKNDTTFNFPKKNYFLCCSRISEEKGYVDVVKAFAKFHKIYPKYNLLIAGFGNPDYINKLKRMSGKYGCNNSIKFLGYREDIRDLIDNAQALIVASRFEGFGRMTAEAAFRGCTVIGHNTGGTKEVLDITGGFPYENDWKELEEKMEKVINLSEDEYTEIATRARKAAVKNFSNEQYVDKVYKVYLKALNKEI